MTDELREAAEEAGVDDLGVVMQAQKDAHDEVVHLLADHMHEIAMELEN